MKIMNIVDTDLLKEYKLIKFINTKKKFETKGLKIHKINNDYDSIYISQDIKTTYFMPAVVYLKSSARTSYMFKLSLDMQYLEDYLFKEINSKDNLDNFTIGDYLIYYNIVEWDTFGTLVDFLIAESNLVFNENPKFEIFKKRLDTFIKDWIDIREKFGFCKKVFTRMLNLFTSFFDEFKKKIPWNLEEKFGKTIR